MPGFNIFKEKQICKFQEKWLDPGVNVIKLFTTVIYRHFMVILSFCGITLYYSGNYHGMAVYYHGICETNVIKHNLT